MAVPKQLLNQDRVKEDLISNFHQKILLKIKNLEYRLSHHIDLKTGTYKGRQVLDPKE